MQYRTFTKAELTEVAMMAESKGLCTMQSETNYGGWTCNNYEIYFDCNIHDGKTYIFDLAMMQKWDEVRVWMESRFKMPMKMYIASRGDFDDAFTVIRIEPAYNMCVRKQIRCHQYEHMRMRTMLSPLQRLGDYDALMALRKKMN